MDLTAIRVELASALVVAIVSGVSFIAKQIYDWIKALAAERRAREARLLTLLSLLLVGRSVFKVQADIRDRLQESIAARDPTLAASHVGFEAVFSHAFQSLTVQEREMHAVIRGYTVAGLKPINEAALAWLREDTDFKITSAKDPVMQELGEQLRALEAHVQLWLAKFAVWIPETPQHALVYLDDEVKHGVPFPSGIEGTVLAVARSVGRRRA
ncbi:hypothetical protein LJR175_008405 [Variovorax sp. LjRoot175]|uniref:hypothetical protein n=1 Tax=Variovorax sp. LjRoot175 TaxID=3342276 RepID=UPI003ECDCC5B